ALVFAIILSAHLLIGGYVPSFFSADRALYLAPFFFAGLAANRFQGLLSHDRVQTIAIAAFSALMTLNVLAAVELFGEYHERSTPFAPALLLSGVMALMYVMPRIPWLGWVGGFSFSIYLYHVFFTAGTRIVLNRIGVTDLEPHFVIGLIAGIVGPILL